VYHRIEQYVFEKKLMIMKFVVAFVGTAYLDLAASSAMADNGDVQEARGGSFTYHQKSNTALAKTSGMPGIKGTHSLWGLKTGTSVAKPKTIRCC